ncbi:unnamed protein product, partial [Effrenium voratum]
MDEQQLKAQERQALATTAVLGTLATTLTVGLGCYLFRGKEADIFPVNYGGRVTDDKDVRLISAFLKRYFNEGVLQDGYKLSPLNAYTCPDEGSLEEVREHVRKLPMDEDPQVFGLHPNAQITAQTEEARKFLDIILSVQPRIASAGQVRPEQIISEMAEGFLERVPKVMSRKEASPETYKKTEDGGIISLGVFHGQEMDRFNALIGCVQSTLITLGKAIRGLVVMSAQLEEMYHAFLLQKLPPNWAEVAYPCLKPLNSWFTDFEERIAFMGRWLREGPPASFWVPCFYFPQGFMTCAKQVHARKTKIPIDALVFWQEPSSCTDALAATLPADGVNVHGFFLQGAGWDVKKVKMVESEKAELFKEVPVTWIQVVEEAAFHKAKAEPGRYTCPLYKTSLRKGTLATTGHSTNFVCYFHLPSEVEDSVGIRATGCVVAWHYFAPWRYGRGWPSMPIADESPDVSPENSQLFPAVLYLKENKSVTVLVGPPMCQWELLDGPADGEEEKSWRLTKIKIQDTVCSLKIQLHAPLAQLKGCHVLYKKRRLRLRHVTARFGPLQLLVSALACLATGGDKELCPVTSRFGLSLSCPGASTFGMWPSWSGHQRGHQVYQPADCGLTEAAEEEAQDEEEITWMRKAATEPPREPSNMRRMLEGDTGEESESYSTSSRSGRYLGSSRTGSGHSSPRSPSASGSSWSSNSSVAEKEGELLQARPPPGRPPENVPRRRYDSVPKLKGSGKGKAPPLPAKGAGKAPKAAPKALPIGRRLSLKPSPVAEAFKTPRYANPRPDLRPVRAQMEAVWEHFFMLWTIRAGVTCRSEYETRTALRLDSCQFMWTGVSMLSMARSHQWNYEASDRTSLLQDAILQQVPKRSRFSISVLLGIFCSFSAAQVVQDNLSDVLKARTLRGAAEVLVAKSEAPSALFPSFSIWGRVKQHILQKKNVEEAKDWLREQNFFVSAYAGQLPLRDQAGCTRNKRDVLKEFLAKGLQSVGALCAKNIFRIYTRARVPKVLLKEDSQWSLTGPGARKFLNLAAGREASLNTDTCSTAAFELYSRELRLAWLSYRRAGTRLIKRYGAETLEGLALAKHLSDMSTTDAFQFQCCESIKALQTFEPAILQLVLDEPPEGLYNRWVKERLEYYRRVEPSAPLRDVSIVDQKDSEASISLSSDTDESVDTQSDKEAPGGRWADGPWIESGHAPKLQHFALGLRACGACAAWRDAIGVLQMTGTARLAPDNQLFHGLVMVSKQAGKWQVAVQLLEDMHIAQQTPDVVSYNATMSSCERGSHWHAAIGLFESMQEAEVTPSRVSHNAIISCCEKGGQWVRALDFFQRMSTARITPDVVSFNATISSCRLDGQWPTAVSLLGGMPGQTISPDVISYNATISSCDRKGNWQLALGLFEDMKRARLSPDLITFNALLSSCERVGQWQRCLRLLELQRSSRIDPDVMSYSACVSASEKAQHWTLALRFFEDLQRNVQADVISYSAAVA